VTLLEQLRAILAALDHAGIEYALVGGLAVAVWGAPRATQDIDLLVRPESVDAIVTAIEPLGFRFRALPMTFSDGMQLQRVSKIEHGALLTVDLLLVDTNLEPIWESRRQLDVEGTPIWVISREALIQMKIAAGRTRDVQDVERLEEIDR
jgi:predicted nucleotidyltransferase